MHFVEYTAATVGTNKFNSHHTYVRLSKLFVMKMIQRSSLVSDN